MLVGEYKGKKIQDIKKSIQKDLLDKKEAVIYYEPEKTVVSRSGEECVVALCNQWYLDYGESNWKKQTEKLLEQVNCYHDEVKKNLQVNSRILSAAKVLQNLSLGDIELAA